MQYQEKDSLTAWCAWKGTPGINYRWFSPSIWTLQSPRAFVLDLFCPFYERECMERYCGLKRLILNRGLSSQRRIWSYFVSSHFVTGAINHVDVRLFFKVNWHKTGGKTRACLKVFPFFSEVMQRPLRGSQIECMPWGEGHGKVMSLTKCAISFTLSVSPSLPHSPHTQGTCTAENAHWRLRVRTPIWTMAHKMPLQRFTWL